MDLISGVPLWPSRDEPVPGYPELDSDLACTVAILGGGVTGALVADHLVEAGIDTVVLDKRHIGRGSTAASTALVQYELDVTLTDLTRALGSAHAERAYVAGRDAVRRFHDLVGGLDTPVGFEPKESLYIAGVDDDPEIFRIEWKHRRSIGLDVEFLDSLDVAERFPFRRAAALLTHEAAQVDSFALTHALISRAVSRGVRVFECTEVRRIQSTSDGVLLHTRAGPCVRAKWIVFATGYETHSFLRKKVARLVSTYAIASTASTDVSSWAQGQCLIWEHADPYLYLRTTSDGRVIVGGEDEDFRDPHKRDALIPQKAERLAKRFRTLMPGVPLTVEFAWAGTFGQTADGLAYVGAHPDWPNACFALGYGGNGMTLSLLAAEIIRDAMVGRANADAELFRFGR